MPGEATLEDRIRAVEDKLAILNLIASHPPSADTAAQPYIASIFADDAVLDLGGGKRADGSEAISHIVTRPEHSAAVAGGLAHFAGLPHIVLDGDRAIVTSYLQILTPHQTADAVEVPGHGTSKGHRVHRVGANRWELLRTADGWKVARRSFRTLDGTEPALELLRQAVPPPAPAAPAAR